MNNSNLQKVIEDYFSITGRPIATLTVDEYAKFIEIAKQTTMIPSRSFSFQGSPDSISEVSSKEIEVIEDDEPNQRAPIVPITKQEFVPAAKPEKKKPSKEEMLKMMRSVSS